MHTTIDDDPEILRLRGLVANHPVYEALGALPALRRFMEHHVFAVWDFMSLVKSLQRELTCVELPWRPPVDREAARLVNEIVLGEESDLSEDGRPASHFDLYLEAMDEVGADAGPILALQAELAAGRTVSAALAACGAPEPSRRFVESTFGWIQGPVHVRAAALLFGREDLIPSMFGPIVATLARGGAPCGRLVYYLERHIEVDGGEHAELARRILGRLVGGDPGRARQARDAAAGVLADRLRLWDGVRAALVDASARGRVAQPAS